MQEKLDFERFADDVDVGLAAVLPSELPGPIEESKWIYVPEQLFARLLSIGTGYRMHFSSFIDTVVDTILNSQQCASFKEEICFLGAIVDDEALRRTIRLFVSQIELIEREPRRVLVISPP